MKKENIIRKHVLLSCLEESPLVHHVWGLNTLFPEGRGKKNQALAMQMMKDLYEAGMIEFFYDILGGNLTPEELEKIDDQEVIHKIFTDDLFWVPIVVGDKYILAQTTSKGDEYFRKLPYEPLLFMSPHTK